MLGNVQIRRKLELSSGDVDISNKGSMENTFHENAGLSYVIDYSEIVIIHDSIKLICHMLKGFKELLCFILEINILDEHGRR